MSSKKLTEIGKSLGTGKRIRQIRGNLSQTAFGKLLGVTAAAVSRWEAGRIPDDDMRKKIADIGKVSDEWILYGEEIKKTPDSGVKYSIRTREIAPEDYDAQPLRSLETILLIQIIALVEQFLEDRPHKLFGRRQKLQPEQKGRLISLIYEHCRDNRETPTLHLVEKYLLLAD